MKYLLGLLLLIAACGTSSTEAGPGPAASGEGGAGAHPESEGGEAGAEAKPVNQPRLLASAPKLRETDVYPAPLWLGNGEEVTIDLEFSAPMQLERDLQLEAADHTRKISSLAWSDDKTQLRLFVRPDFTFPHPLVDATEYRLDLSALVDDSGQGLEPNTGLDGRVLFFNTGQHDALLNHSCGHTFFGPFGNVVSSANRNVLTPDVSKTHVQYAVTLPAQEGSGTYGGWVRAKFPTQGPYRLYFDEAVPLQLVDSSGETRELVLLSTPAACPGISQEATIDVRAGEDLYLFLGPDSAAERHMIVELVVE